MESRKFMGRMYLENRFKNAKAGGSERVKMAVSISVHSKCDSGD